MSNTARLDGVTISSVRALRERDLVRCTYCGVEGPKTRLAEHVSADHPALVTEADAGFTVGIPSRFRPALEAIRAQTGAPFGRVIADALDRALPHDPDPYRKWERQAP